MKIRSIEIKGLFDNFDYVIDFPSDQDILILTGPNGYGKTHILNIVNNLFYINFWYFLQLEFKEISLFTLDEEYLTIVKNSKEPSLKISLFRDNEVVEKLKYNYHTASQAFRELKENLSSSIRGDITLELKGEFLHIEDFIRQHKDNLPINVIDFFYSGNIGEQIEDFLHTVDVHLIKEQRLIKKVSTNNIGVSHGKSNSKLARTVESHASDLKQKILEMIEKSFKLSQVIDSTYPSRLINEKNKILEREYQRRFAKLIAKQDKLTKYDLYQFNHDTISYNQADAKALLVYLNDLESKLKIFDNLLDKLELFTGILNQRRFTFKSIHIDRNRGFIFKSDKGVELNLHQLSSGEQHEVVLLYELIFNTQPNMIVLIDEPEISLHITWQKEFLNDLLKIIELQQFQVIIATHSPSIINDRWDLVHTLEKKEVYA